MSFVMGSSCFLHSPICQSRFPSSSQSIFFFSCTRNAETKRKKSIGPMASMRHEDPNNSVHCKRRAILFVGISILPLLQLRAGALEGTGTRKLTLKTLKLLQIYVLDLYFLLLLLKFFSLWLAIAMIRNFLFLEQLDDFGDMSLQNIAVLMYNLEGKLFGFSFE